MQDLNTSESRFRNFPKALLAVDVTFHQSDRPIGALAERKIYFSGKHKLYVLIEMAVLPNGLAVACSNRYPEAFRASKFCSEDVHYTRMYSANAQ